MAFINHFLQYTEVVLKVGINAHRHIAIIHHTGKACHQRVLLSRVSGQTKSLHTEILFIFRHHHSPCVVGAAIVDEQNIAVRGYFAFLHQS